MSDERPDRPGEFELIGAYFAPLADAPGAFGLTDDAALFEIPEGESGVVTTDAMVADIHFFADDPPEAVGWKLLAVNLSDLAAMGARPIGYTLDLVLPADWRPEWLAGFVQGLGECQRRFDVPLLGGDTTGTTGALTVAITAIGTVPASDALRRKGARQGDAVWVSGTIGDGALAVQLRKGWTPAGVSLNAEERARLSARLDRPEPRLALGQALRGHASAAIDVSDGLCADLGHICEVSEVGAEISLALVPLSPVARRLLAEDAELAATILAGGDDFELVFTAHPSAEEAILAAAHTARTPVARIGIIGEGRGVQVTDETGREIALARPGFTHF